MAKLPEGWIVADLGEFCEGIRGVTYKPDDLAQVNTEKTITLLRSNNIKAGALNFKDVQHVAQKNVNQKQVAQLGDIAVCMSNGSKRLVGKSAAFKYIPEERRYTVGSFCSIFRPLESACPVFVEQVFCSDQFQKQVDFSLAGSAINNLKNSDLIAYQFLKPPIPEQQKIATILSSVDEVIEKTRAQIDKLKDLKIGMMQELLTKGIGHTEFKDSPVGRIPAEWMVVRLGGSLECIDSGWSPSCIEIPPAPGKWGVLKVSSVTRGEFLENESKTLPDELLPRNNAQVHAGDVLLTRANGVAELVGKCVIVRKEPQAKLMMSDKILRLKPSQTLHNEFLLHVFNSQIIRKQIELSWGGSSGQKNIGQSDIKSYLIPLPSVEEQRLIARSITQVERVVFDQNKKLVALMNTKKALMQDLLTGKVRVKLTDKESAAV